MIVALKTVEKMRPARHEIIITTGVRPCVLRRADAGLARGGDIL